jgi:phage/plasmid-like protein (TIGR03299 family)|tara:strand:- start:11957 stop:12910 length:954 start_codon:yes stop_codon:yes gene_type:complete
MSHEIETMAYAGRVPWHGLGVEVTGDLTPYQMQQKADLDWRVETAETHAFFGEDIISTGTKALIRESDHKVLAPMIGKDWEPVQNTEAFEFFNEFCAAGDMEMHTAGSLKGGQIVWVLAKIKESFDVLEGDRVDNYLLFSNPHMYGKSINVRMTPTRVVCNNTLQMSLSATSKNEVSLNHRRKFDANLVKQQMGIASEKFDQYREFSRFLASKKAGMSDVIQFMNGVFPHSNTKGKEVDKYEALSPTAKSAFDVIDTQPGAEFARGTWWNALNAVTFTTDHVLGRTADARLTSAWYGHNAKRKLVAVNSAIKYAEAA